MILFNLIADVLYGWLDPASATAERRPGALPRRQRVAVGRGLAALLAPQAWPTGPVDAAAMMLACSLGPLVWKVGINDIDFRPPAPPSRRIRSAPTTWASDICWRACSTAAHLARGGLAAMLMAMVVGVSIGAIAGISRGGSTRR